MTTFAIIVGGAVLGLVAYGVSQDVIRFFEDRDRRRHIEAVQQPSSRTEELKRKAKALRDLRAYEAREVVTLERQWNIPAYLPRHERQS